MPRYDALSRSSQQADQMTAAALPYIERAAGRGMIQQGLEAAQADNIKVFHAGTASAGGQVVTSGGRVLCVTALGDNIAAAQKDCYRAVDKISWEGMTLRRDIGWRAVARYSRSD